MRGHAGIRDSFQTIYIWLLILTIGEIILLIRG